MSDEPSIIGVHVDSDASIVWSDGVFTGDQALVDAAIAAAESGVLVGLTPTGPYIHAGFDTPDGAAAAMLTAHPGRMILKVTPPALRKSHIEPGIIY